MDLWRTDGRALKDKLRAFPNNYTRKGSDRRSAYATAGLPVAGSASRLSAVCVFFSLLAGPRTSFSHPAHHLSASRSVPRPGCLLPQGPAVASGPDIVPATSRTALQRFSHSHVFQKARFARRLWDLRARCHLSFAIGTCNTLCGTLLFCALRLVAFPIFIR